MSYNNEKNKNHVPPLMRGAMSGKAKDFKKSWKQIIKYTKPFHKLIIFAMIFAIIKN